MLRIALKGILGHKVRFGLTTLAVVLGVSFVAASFILRDGLNDTFDGLVADIYENTDVQVRGVTEFSESDFEGDVLIDQSIGELVASVDGVAESYTDLQLDGIIPIAPSGDPLSTFGPPIFGGVWVESPISVTQIIEGTPPGPGEFVIDITSAEDEGFTIGETYEVIFPNGRESFTLSGILRFGDEDALVGAVLTGYDADEFRALTGTEDKIQTVTIAADPGVSQEELTARVQNVLPSGVEAVTGEQVIEENEDEFGEIIGIIGNAFTGFALVSLLVASFLIANIFNITIGQRIRELALLRAVGATTTQVRTSVLAESIVIGLLSAVLGIGGGVLMAQIIITALDAAGAGFPPVDMIIAPLTIIVALVVAIFVTLLASLLPAFQAGRVPPVAAMREGYQLERKPRQRLVFGLIVTGIGALLMANGLFGSASGSGLIFALGFGCLFVFVGTTTLSPLIAAPVVRTLGEPLRAIGISGRLAQQNSAGSADKTATAAGALMIGLALVASAGVFGASLKETISGTLDNSIEADFFLTEDGFGGGFGSGLAERVSVADEFDQVAAFRFGNIRVDGDEKQVFATNVDQLDGLIDPDVVSGDLADVGAGSLLLHEDPASDLGLSVGDPITIEFASTETTELVVGAIYSDALILGNWVIDIEVWDQFFSIDNDVFVAARIADGVEIPAAQQALDAITEDFPQVIVQDQAEFRASQESQVDFLLTIINTMLAFSLLIALLGIAITMTLAVFERTREIGLLRAVGMTRRQAWSMILGESVLVAVFGALLGLAVGLVFGYAAVSAIPESIVNTFAIPWGTLVASMIVSAIIGLIAGLFPAWRAGRMNVLDAISHL